MVADIKLPDLEHRVAILRRKAAVDDLEITFPDEVITLIATAIQSNVRELEGAIIRIVAYASLKRRPISIVLAQEVLRRHLGPDPLIRSRPPNVTIGQIQQVVADVWGVTAEGLQSKLRTKTLTVPRQIAMHLTRDILALQLVEIGKAFGGRDHSTVIHSLQRASDLMATDPATQARLVQVRRRLEERHGDRSEPF